MNFRGLETTVAPPNPVDFHDFPDKTGTNLERYTDTGLIPVYPHAAHALLILLVLLPQLPVALSLAF